LFISNPRGFMRCKVEFVLAASLRIFPVFGGISGLNKMILNI
jgi:hypothetical protein